jgi:hypothetical protein
VHVISAWVDRGDVQHVVRTEWPFIGHGTAPFTETMILDSIPFISSYCDRWCERCALTSRCSAFAVSAAIGMCGDVREGLHLALGAPRPEGDAPSAVSPASLAPFEPFGSTPEEQAAFDREEAHRCERIGDTSIMKLAFACTGLAFRWLAARAEHVAAHADVVLKEALAIAGHDAALVTAKLQRALDGRDRHERGDGDDDHPVQNDWNGSAKVALICLGRCEHAWRVIAESTRDDTPGLIAARLCNLRREVELVFPNARLFVRPGFDEPAA